MSWEPQLRAWLDEMLSEVSVPLEDREAGPESKTEPEPPGQGDRQADDLPADTRSTMDTLQLCIKYLVFDVWATHRENQHLRQTLKQCRKQDGEK